MDKPLKPHPIVEEDLHAYVDDALDTVRRKAVRDHLDRHPEDAATVASLTAQRQLLRAAFAPIADEPIPDRLRIHAPIQAQHKDRGDSSAREPWPWRMAAAVVLALGAGGMGGWQMHDAWAPSSGIALLAGEARSSYSLYAAEPVGAGNGSGDATRLARLVSDKLQQDIEIPDLSRSGYQYVGGQMVSTVNGPAGLFFYDRADGTRMALMIRAMKHEKEAPMMEQSAGAVGGFTWAARGLGYSVVGTEAPDLLHPVADEVRRQVRAKSAV